jgi:hypothetical protein
MSGQMENIETRTQQAAAAYNQSDKPNLAKLARERWWAWHNSLNMFVTHHIF